VIAIAGLVFGQDAAENAIVARLSDLMGPQPQSSKSSSLHQASTVKKQLCQQ
jgi:hypothetical protein